MKKIARQGWTNYATIQSPALKEYNEGNWSLILIPLDGSTEYAVWWGWADSCIGTIWQDKESRKWGWTTPRILQARFAEHPNEEEALQDLYTNWRRVERY